MKGSDSGILHFHCTVLYLPTVSHSKEEDFLQLDLSEVASCYSVFSFV